MMWFLLLLIYIAHHTELVITKGENRLILSGGSHPCEGYVEIYHDNLWGYVGDKYWNKDTEKVVCRSIHCGIPVESSTEEVARPENSTVWLNELHCKGDEENLWDCSWPGWGVSVYRKPSVKKITCSNEIKIRLHPFKCAGAVQYSTDGKTWLGHFCADKWDENEANALCESLQCGKSKERTMHEWMIWKDFKGSKKMTISCSDITNWKYLWQCVTKESTCTIPASAVCEAHERLQLRGDASNVCSGQLEKVENDKWSPFKSKPSPDVCQQLNCGANVSHSLNDKGTQLTCKDKVNVVLKDGGKPSKCYGAVHVNVNGESFPVCATSWTEKEAEVVCKELNCGEVISQSNKRTTLNEFVGMDNVHCLGSESSLWHCRAKRNSNSLCSSQAYVVCAGSISVRLKDGPGKCAGRLEVQYEGRWKVYKNEWTKINSEIVCKQLNCGSKGEVSHKKFCNGSDDFLTTTVKCNPDVKTISECFNNTSNNPSDKEDRVEITCEEHKMIFLKGNGSNPCSGMVGIEHGKKTYWLSGSKTWNQESANIVCQQKHCGNASTFSTSTPTADMLANIWDKSYNCSSNTKSLFECEANTPGPNDTIATVTCTGTVKMKLTQKCWGHVLANVDGKRGGVCADSWTEEHSKMLCKSLNCGDSVLESRGKQGQEPVLISSLQSTNQNTSLTQYNMVLNDDKNITCNQNQAYVVCSGSVRPRFSSSRDKCSGNVEVLYEGNWLPMCTDALKDKEAQNTICEELECGKAVDKIAYIGLKSARSHAISQLQCPTNGAKSITACKVSASQKSCTPAGLQCADWRKMKVSDTCKGHVTVYSNGNHYAVSNEGWNETEGQRLCQDLNCGSFKSFESTVAAPRLDNRSDSFWDRNFSCVPGQDQENIWDCEKKTSLALKQQLFIECQDVPKVTLTERCKGEVKINEMGVCASNWDDNYSHLLCQEQDCSNAIVSKRNFTKPDPNTEYHHVSCDDNDHKLGQCVRVKGKCDGELVSVYCVANVLFNTTEKCGGQILVNYGHGWEKVCPLNLSQEFKKKLCQELDCGNNRDIKGNAKKVEELL
ncbi:scavenger receptor cysteine-rich type 1 protein M160 isoform X2 [Trachinotus anak]|uniref:scavenger receptor cysteine-rich type 1 protein M160 isoform X2 n=1 Tax=Trachinotus anak TaxID=443729 RepID=UPI0039F2069B